MEAMKKPTFLHQKQPLLTVMLQAHDPHRTKELMRLSYPEGAEAFGIPFCMMKAEYRNKETYKELFEAAHSLPVYFTNYRKE